MTPAGSRLVVLAGDHAFVCPRTRDSVAGRLRRLLRAMGRNDVAVLDASRTGTSRAVLRAANDLLCSIPRNRFDRVDLVVSASVGEVAGGGKSPREWLEAIEGFRDTAALFGVETSLLAFRLADSEQDKRTRRWHRRLANEIAGSSLPIVWHDANGWKEPTDPGDIAAHAIAREIFGKVVLEGDSANA